MEEDKTYKEVHHDIDEYMACADGHWFKPKTIYDIFNYRTRPAKRYCWQVLNEYVKKEKLEKDGEKYRLPQVELQEISLDGIDTGTEIDVKFPMELERYIKIPQRTVFVVAGTPGAGKTAFLLNFLLRNMKYEKGITLWSNDMTPEEIKERFVNSGLVIPDPLPFKMWERADAFADVVNPDGINVIDYLDLDSEFYMVGAELTRIHRKLRTGMAIIGLQKNKNTEVGTGGYMSLKRPKFYATLDHTTIDGRAGHILKFTKARGRRKSSVDPKGMEFKFQLYGGIKFLLKEYG